jgi:hypothetical protein
MMVLWHILSRAVWDVLNIMTDGQVEGDPSAWPPCSPDLNPLYFYLWGHLKTPVYAAPVDNQEAHHHPTVDASQTILIYPGIF